MGENRVDIILGAKDDATRTLRNVTSQIQGLKTPIAALSGVLAAVGATQAFASLVRGAFDAAQAAGEAQAATAKLAQAMASTGANVATALPRFEAFATQLQSQTGIDDDVIKSQAALLASIGRLSGEGLERATKAALDLGAVTGNQEAAFAALAKAATGNTTALGKLGIKVDESLPPQKRFAAALSIIEAQLGGSAAAAIDTYLGRLGAFQSAVGNLQEAIGGPFQEVFETLLRTVLTPTVEELTSAVSTSDSYRASILNLGRAFVGAGKATLEFYQSQIALGEQIKSNPLFAPFFRDAERLKQILADLRDEPAVKDFWARTFGSTQAAGNPLIDTLERVKGRLSEADNALVSLIVDGPKTAATVKTLTGATNESARAAEAAAGKWQEFTGAVGQIGPRTQQQSLGLSLDKLGIPDPTEVRQRVATLQAALSESLTFRSDALSARDFPLVRALDEVIAHVKDQAAELEKEGVDIGRTLSNALRIEIPQLPGLDLRKVFAFDQIEGDLNAVAQGAFDSLVGTAERSAEARKAIEAQLGKSLLDLQRDRLNRQELAEKAAVDRMLKDELDTTNVSAEDRKALEIALAQSAADAKAAIHAKYEAERLALTTDNLTRMIDQEDALRLAIEEGQQGVQKGIDGTRVKLESLSSSISHGLRDVLIRDSLRFGDILVDSAFRGRQAFRGFFKDVLADMAKVIVRALIIRAIMALLKFTGGGVAAGSGAAGGVLASSAVSLSKGGLAGDIAHGRVGLFVPAAAGLAVQGAVRGRDSVPAMLAPGEIVIPDGPSAQLIASARAAGVSGQIAGPNGVGLSREFIAFMLERAAPMAGAADRVRAFATGGVAGMGAAARSVQRSFSPARVMLPQATTEQLARTPALDLGRLERLVESAMTREREPRALVLEPKGDVLMALCKLINARVEDFNLTLKSNYLVTSRSVRS